MEQPNYSYFPLKTWGLTMVLSPMLFLFMLQYGDGMHSQGLSENLELLFPLIAFGCAFSLPSLIIYWLLYAKIRRFDIPYLSKKILLAIIGIALILTTFYVIDRSFFLEMNSIVF